VSERLRRVRRGVRGGGAGGRSPPRGGSGAAPPIFFFFFGPTYFAGPPTYFWDDIFPGRHIIGTTYFRDHMILGGFSAHGFLLMVFYFRLRN
jgi:hypothetical protein